MIQDGKGNEEFKKQQERDKEVAKKKEVLEALIKNRRWDDAQPVILGICDDFETDFMFQVQEIHCATTTKRFPVNRVTLLYIWKRRKFGESRAFLETRYRFELRNSIYLLNLCAQSPPPEEIQGGICLL